MKEVSGNNAVTSGDVSDSILTPQELLESFRRVSDLLAKASTQLLQHGFELLPDGTYRQTPEARRAEVDALPLDSYQFRDLVRAEAAESWDNPTPALDRLHEEVQSALDGLGEKFGFNDLGDLCTGSDVINDIADLLTEYITSAERIADDDAERAADEEVAISDRNGWRFPKDLKIVSGGAK